MTVTPETAARNIRLLLLDVDGVLTDGRLYYGNDGEELKAFQDGLGIKLLQRLGIEVAIMRGRNSTLLARRGGGRGAVREAAEFILRAQGKLDAALEVYR